MMTEASADVCSISRMLTKRDIQLARGVQQECADDNCREPAGLCSHLRSSLVLLHMSYISQNYAACNMRKATERAIEEVGSKEGLYSQTLLE